MKYFPYEANTPTTLIMNAHAFEFLIDFLKDIKIIDEFEIKMNEEKTEYDIIITPGVAGGEEIRHKVALDLGILKIEREEVKKK